MNEVLANLYRVSVFVNGMRLPIYSFEGRNYIEAKVGLEFSVEVTNRDSKRIEVLMSIDGRNTLKDEAANLSNQGMVVGGYETWRNVGWRENNSTVRKFVFSSPETSIAMKTTGSVKNVGVIGVAAYVEKRREVYVQPPVDGFPYFRKGSFSVSNASLGTMRSMEAPVGTGIGDRVNDAVGTTTFERETFQTVQAIEIQYRPYTWLLEHGVVSERFPSSGYDAPNTVNSGYGKY